MLKIRVLQCVYWVSQRRTKSQAEKNGRSGEQRGMNPGSADTTTGAPEADTAGDAGPLYAASSSSHGSSGERQQLARTGRRTGSSAEAPRTPDARDAVRPSAPVTVACMGGRMTSSGRAARRAGSAAAAAFAALSPRARQRPGNVSEGPELHGPVVTARGRGGSDRSIPPVTRIAMPPHGLVQSHDERTAGGRMRRRPADMAASGIPGVSNASAPPVVRSDDTGHAAPLHRLQSNVRAAVPMGETPKSSGPVGEAAAVRALNSGLAWQPRHVYGGGAATRVGPAAVGGNSSSGSIESGSAMSSTLAALGASPPAPMEGAAPQSTTDTQRRGEIDIALSVVSVDSVKTDGGSPDGQTVSLRTWRTGAALAAHAGDGGESVVGESVFGDGSVARRGNSEDSSGHPEGRNWRSAVRRLQRGNSRMLRLLRSRGDDD